MSSNPIAPSVKVAIIDDHDVVHAGVQAWCIDADPPIAVSDAYLTPGDFQRQHDGAASGDDVVILDLQFDGKRPDFDALSRLVDAGHRVVVFSLMTSDEIILTCLEMGAVSYLVKSEGKAHLVDAIHCAAAGVPYTAPIMARAMLQGAVTGRIGLSDREKEVLRSWFQTESKQLVGQRLFIEPSTVKTHLQRVRAKYAAVGRPAPTKSALLARAIQDGLLGVGDL